MFWSHEPVAPWQTDSWLEEMRRTLRLNQFLRMIENRFVTTESHSSNWPRGINASIRARPLPRNPGLSIWAGVDASIKRDSTAIVAVTWVKKKRSKCAWLPIGYFSPRPTEPLDFEATIERTLLDLHKRFFLRKVFFDPWQMQATAQRLTRAGLRIVEFPQSPANLTAASQNLFELIQGQNLVLYPDPGMRLAISRTVALETPRGWRLRRRSKRTRSTWW